MREQRRAAASERRDGPGHGGTAAPRQASDGRGEHLLARRRGRWRFATATWVALAFLAGSLTSGAGAVWASHQFGDVPTDHPFHADIDWMVDHGITNGYEDGTFRPTSISRIVACPAGKRGIAAGGLAPGPNLIVTGSAPLAGGDGRTWEVFFARRDAAVAPGAMTTRVWLLCRPG